MKKLIRFLAIAFLALINSYYLFAQWVHTYTFDNENPVTSLAISGNNLFAGTHNNGVYLSADSGFTWTAVNNGLNPGFISSLLVSDTNLFAGTNDGVFLSTNNGLSWTAMNNGLIDTEYLIQHISSLVISGKNIFAGSSINGVYLSTNNGINWTAVNTGLPEHAQIKSMAVSDSTLFASVALKGIYRSTNNGTSWTAANSGPGMNDIWSFTVSGTRLFASTVWNGVIHSSDNGTSWNYINNGLIGETYSMLHFGGNIFVCSITYIYITTNNGASWTAVSDESNCYTMYTIGMYDNYLFAASLDGQVWRRPLSDMLTSIENDNKILPTLLNLEQNYPNPFNPTTTINYQVQNTGKVVLNVFDVLGRTVATLVDEKKSSGSYKVEWNAANMPSGVYFYRLQSGSFSETKKLILLK